LRLACGERSARGGEVILAAGNAAWTPRGCPAPAGAAVGSWGPSRTV